MRALGIPARVGSGYAVDESARQGGSAILLSGANSHAWPEIYVDGVGWVDRRRVARAQRSTRRSARPTPICSACSARWRAARSRCRKAKSSAFEPIARGAAHASGCVLARTLLVLLPALLALGYRDQAVAARRAAVVEPATRAARRLSRRARSPGEARIARRFGESREAFARARGRGAAVVRRRSRARTSARASAAARRRSIARALRCAARARVRTRAARARSRGTSACSARSTPSRGSRHAKLDLEVIVELSAAKSRPARARTTCKPHRPRSNA